MDDNHTLVKKLLAQVQSGRIERRMPSKIAARLHRPDDQTVSDVVSIEDISSHGARVIGRCLWQPHDHVTLADLMGEFSTDAEVVYCERLGDDTCAVGLKFEKTHP